jgi:GTPase SAR1 family protein
MADELAENIRKLADLHKAGILNADAYHQALANLRHEHGDAAVDDRLRALGVVDARTAHQQDIGGQAQVGVAVAGTINGNVTVYFTAAGVRDPSDEQRELLASYLRRLAERCDRLRLSGAVRRERRDAAPALTLSQVYVTLAAQRRVLLAEADSEDAFAEHLAAGDPDVVTPDAARYVVPGHPDLRAGRMAEPEQTRYRLERPLLLTEALSQRRRLVLLGGPGSGKSSFLRHLAVSLAHAPDQGDPALPGWSVGRLLPLYVSLGGFAGWCREGKRSIDGLQLWQYLFATAQEYGLDELESQLRRAFRNGGMLVLLDGLDEVAEPDVRGQVARAVAALADATTYVVVTCRVRSFDETLTEVFAGWGAPVDLAPFTLGQMRRFVAGWYGRSAESGAIDAAEAAERSDELIERLVAVPALRDLSQTPLLLTIMTILHYYEGKLPEDRAELYEDLVQLFLNRWTQYRREAGAPLPLLQQLKAKGQLVGADQCDNRATGGSLGATGAGTGAGAWQPHDCRCRPGAGGRLAGRVGRPASGCL